MKVPEPRKLPSGSWFIQLRLGGKSVSVTAATKKECIQQATLIKAEHVSGRKVQKRGSALDMTLDEAIQAYCDEKSAILSPSTLRGYATMRRNRFKAVMGQKIGAEHNWQAIVNEEAKEVSAKTVYNAWGLVATVLRHYKVQVPEVSLPQVVDNDLPWLDYEQIGKFCAAAKGKPGELAALFALHSLRRSEIMDLTWDNVDLERGWIEVKGSAVFDADNNVVHKKTNKNKSSQRRVPIMIPALKDALQKVEDKSGYIITGNLNTAYNQINRICREAKLPEVGVHGLRRSFASLAYHLGWPERQTMEIGGWSDAKTMHKIYIKLAAADISAATNNMAAFYASANKNANDNAE